MSLYTYVPGKAELLDLMLDSVRGEALLPGGAPGGWRALLEWRARADWALYARHPWALYVSRARAVLGPHELAVFEETLHAVAGLGLSGREMLAVVSVLEGYVRGAGPGRAGGGARSRQRTGLTDDQWWAAREPLLGQYFDPGRFPTVARVQREGGIRPPSGWRGLCAAERPGRLRVRAATSPGRRGGVRRTPGRPAGRARWVRWVLRTQRPGWAIWSRATVTARIRTSFWPGAISTP